MLCSHTGVLKGGFTTYFERVIVFMWNTLAIWEITKWGKMQGEFCEHWENFAADGYGFFYDQSSQLENSSGVSTCAIAVLWEWSYSWVFSII